MTRRHAPIDRRSVILSFRFLVTTLLGALTMGVVCVFGSTSSQIGMLGTWISILAGLTLAHISQVEHKSRSYAKFLDAAGIPTKLAMRPKMLEQYAEISRSVGKLSKQSDPVLCEFIEKKLVSIAEQTELLSRGEIVFSSTESWRTVYEQILRCPHVKKYQSVAWFKSEEYWQDAPGRKGLELNIELLKAGLLIERIVIIRDSLWPAGSESPAEPVASWIDAQHKQGIKIGLVRESALQSEPDLCSDVGIYGECAVGVQETDDRCRTLKFTLNFDPDDVVSAKDRWNRLLLYAHPWNT